MRPSSKGNVAPSSGPPILSSSSWRVDETYIKVKGEGCMDVPLQGSGLLTSTGATVEFMLSPTRNTQAVKRFFHKALRARHTVPPRVINVDRPNPAYPKAVGKLKKKGILSEDCELRPIKYLNNLIEQAPRGYPRFIKRRVNPGLGLWSFDTAWRTMQGEPCRGTKRCTSYERVRYREQSRETSKARFNSYPPPSGWLLNRRIYLISTRLHSNLLKLLQHYPNSKAAPESGMGQGCWSSLPMGGAAG